MSNNLLLRSNLLRSYYNFNHNKNNFNWKTKENNSNKINSFKNISLNQENSINTNNSSINLEKEKIDNKSNKDRTSYDKNKGFIYFCENYAKFQNGVYVKRAFNKEFFYFRCKLNHNFVLNKIQMVKNLWCNSCKILYNKLKLFAKENNGYLINHEIEKICSFRCQKDHVWKINIKKAFNFWCKACKKNDKKYLKKLLEKENQFINEKLFKKQEQIFKEAKKRMLENKIIESKFKDEEIKDIIKEYKKIKIDIKKISEKQAKKFILENPDYKNLLFNQIKSIYYFIIFPEKIFSRYLKVINKEKRSIKFRKYTLLIHPDKNNHPNSKICFQKFYSIFKNSK